MAAVFWTGDCRSQSGKDESRAVGTARLSSPATRARTSARFIVRVGMTHLHHITKFVRACLKKQAGGAAAVAQTSKSAVSRVSKPASDTFFQGALDFRRAADLEVGDTAGLETCATPEARTLFRKTPRGRRKVGVLAGLLLFVLLLLLLSEGEGEQEQEQEKEGRARADDFLDALGHHSGQGGLWIFVSYWWRVRTSLRVGVE